MSARAKSDPTRRKYDEDKTSAPSFGKKSKVNVPDIIYISSAWCFLLWRCRPDDCVDTIVSCEWNDIESLCNEYDGDDLIGDDPTKWSLISLDVGDTTKNTEEANQVTGRKHQPEQTKTKLEKIDFNLELPFSKSFWEWMSERLELNETLCIDFIPIMGDLEGDFAIEYFRDASATSIVVHSSDIVFGKQDSQGDSIPLHISAKGSYSYKNLPKIKCYSSETTGCIESENAEVVQQ